MALINQYQKKINILGTLVKNTLQINKNIIMEILIQKILESNSNMVGIEKMKM